MFKKISILLICGFLAIITTSCGDTLPKIDIEMEKCLQLPGSPLPDGCKKK